MAKIDKYINKKFGKITVIDMDKERNISEIERKKSGEIKDARKYYLCKCECGNIISLLSFRIGKTKSCGCLKRERAKETKTKQNDYEELEDCYRGWDTKHENCFYISKEDYEVVKSYCWRKHNNYWEAKDKYNNSQSIIKLHRLVATSANNISGEKLFNNNVPDHIDRNTDNNTRSNIAVKSIRENSKNRTTPPHNTSGKMGVSWHNKTEKWLARIVDNNMVRISKSFSTFEEAVEQRLAWEKEFGYIGE